MKAGMGVNTEDSPYRVQVLDRAVGILDILARANAELGALEIAEGLRLHKSTIHRLLMVLEQHRLVAKNPSTGRYSLGLKLFELGSKAVAGLDLREKSQPYLERLVSETGETAHVCVIDKGEVLSLAYVESRHSVRTPATVGRRTPLHCTAVGKAMLAFMPPAELDLLLNQTELKSFTRNTITDPNLLRAELRRVAEQGYAIDDEEIEEGMRCIGAPLRNYSGKVVASISVAGPAYRLSPEKVPLIADSVKVIARQLSVALGSQ